MVNRAKKQSATSGKAYLRERLLDVEATFVRELKNRQKAITHAGSLGDATEDAWIALLKNYLPARYCVAKAFAVDHRGNTTDQLDCLIYDAHFTPALFGKDQHLYVPAEAVYATFEVKQTVDATHLRQAADKVSSLRKLKRTSAPLSNVNGVSKPKLLFDIMGGVLAMKVAWKSQLGNSFQKQFAQYTGDRQLNLILTAESGICDQMELKAVPEILSGPGALIRGLFRLLRALRAQATVAAVEWEKYEAVLDVTVEE
jgi:hypothetical protein